MTHTRFSTGLKKFKAALYAGTLVPVALIPATIVSAQEEAPAFEEIVVTATKRGAQSLQDVPFAVQAVTSDSLEKRAAVSFNDYFAFFPGLNVFDSGPGDKRYIIRGVNSVGAGTVGIYLDEIIITGENAQDGGGRQPDVKMFDIDRIEVLKGPQGSTFGSSSLAGTIRYITAKPDLTDYAAKASATFRSTKGAELGTQLEFMANAPLMNEKFGVRVSGLYLDEPGYIDAPYTGAEGVNREETYAARVALRLEATDRLSFDLMFMAQDTDADGRNYYNTEDLFGNTFPVGQFNQADVARPKFQDEMRFYNIKAEYAAEFGDFVVTASRADRDTVFNRDASAVLASVGPEPRLDPLTEATIITQPKQRTVDSIEARFNSKWDSRFQILAGVFYQKEERDFRSAVLSTDETLDIADNPVDYLDRSVSTEIEEFALFGEVSVDVTDQLSLTLGGRYYDFQIAENSRVDVGFRANPGSGAGPTLESADNGFIGKANLSYKPNDNLMVYAQVSQGFRSGGTNDTTAAQIANVDIPSQYGSDSLVNYEVGVKSEWYNRRLIVNAAAFVIDWSDIQLQSQASDGNVQFPYRGNGGGAQIKGLELEVIGRPFEGFDISLTGNVMDASLTKDNPIPATGLDGDELTYAPDVSLTASVSYEWPVGADGLMARVGADYIYTGSQTTALRPTDTIYADLPAYDRANLSVGLEGETWSVNLAVNNVFNDTSTISVFQNTAFTPLAYVPNRPRTVAFSLQKNF
ncbi:TonB-dependent receptor [Emcibacter nanhaiensis]|nr:TonB-dependent receptor [Emcibacter nanhaiensis]